MLGKEECDKFISSHLGTSGEIMNFESEEEIRAYFSHRNFPRDDAAKLARVAERAIFWWQRDNVCIFRSLCERDCVGCPYRVERVGLIDANVISFRATDEAVNKIARFLWEVEEE